MVSIQHNAPMTSVAFYGGSVSLHHGFYRVESPTWCELKFTLSGPHVCAFARCVRQRLWNLRLLHLLVDRDWVAPSVLAMSTGEGASEV